MWNEKLGSYSFLPLVSCLCELGQLVLSFWKIISNNLSVEWGQYLPCLLQEGVEKWKQNSNTRKEPDILESDTSVGSQLWYFQLCDLYQCLDLPEPWNSHLWIRLITPQKTFEKCLDLKCLALSRQLGEKSFISLCSCPSQLFLDKMRYWMWNCYSVYCVLCLEYFN